MIGYKHINFTNGAKLDIDFSTKKIFKIGYLNNSICFVIRLDYLRLFYWKVMG